VPKKLRAGILAAIGTVGQHCRAIRLRMSPRWSCRNAHLNWHARWSSVLFPTDQARDRELPVRECPT